MSIVMSARCDTPGCKTLQQFSLDNERETGEDVLVGLRAGGWHVEGTFSTMPKSIRLKCQFCQKKEAPAL